MDSTIIIKKSVIIVAVLHVDGHVFYMGRAKVAWLQDRVGA
jgi:hypothetical protein